MPTWPSNHTNVYKILCVWEAYNLFVSFQQINLKQDSFTDFQAIFPALSTDLSFNCTTPKAEEKNVENYSQIYIQCFKFYSLSVHFLSE